MFPSLTKNRLVFLKLMDYWYLVLLLCNFDGLIFSEKQIAIEERTIPHVSSPNTPSLKNGIFCNEFMNNIYSADDHIPLPLVERRMSRSSDVLACFCIDARKALDCRAYSSTVDWALSRPVSASLIGVTLDVSTDCRPWPRSLAERASA